MAGFIFKHRKKFLFTTLVICTLFTIVLPSCREDDNPGPTLQFISGGNYISTDTCLKAGQAFLFGIKAENLFADITNFKVKRIFNGEEEVILDTGIHNATFSYSQIMNKGVYDTEKWVFTVTDQEGKRAEIFFILTTDTAQGYDSVLIIPSVIFGAQSNTAAGSFFDPDDQQMYFLNQAFLIQDSIHLCYYYDPAGDYNTIASPGANIDSLIFPGASGISNWTVRHESRFFETTISVTEFDQVQNDSLLIAAYDVLNAKRKAKNLMADEIYSFKLINGKFGLFKVIQVIGAESGTVEISLKLQR